MNREQERKLDELLRLARETLAQGKNIMSAITTYTDQVNANFATIKTNVAALDSAIQNLAAQVAASGTLSATDAAALQSVVDQSAALAASTAVPPPPAPTP